MTLQELKTAISELSTEDLRTLEDYIVTRRQLLEQAHPIDMDKLERAIDAFREGLSEEEIEEITRAMSGEPLHSQDEVEWQG